MTLTEHARSELQLLGEDPAIVAWLTATVAAFASYGHGSSQDDAIDLLNRLLRHEALTPLTADPQEWIDRSEMSGMPMWQNSRQPTAISLDSGRTYTVRGDRDRVVTSAPPPTWIAGLCDRFELTLEEAARAVQFYLDAAPIRRRELLTIDGLSPAERQEYLRAGWGSHGAMLAELIYEQECGPYPVIRGGVEAEPR